MIELPRDLPILERDAVRLVVRDSEDRILLRESARSVRVKRDERRFSTRRLTA